MASSGEDEFGGVDDEEMVLAATQAELTGSRAPRIESLAGFQPHKRRRLDSGRAPNETNKTSETEDESPGSGQENNYGPPTITPKTSPPKQALRGSMSTLSYSGHGKSNDGGKEGNVLQLLSKATPKKGPSGTGNPRTMASMADSQMAGSVDVFGDLPSGASSSQDPAPGDFNGPIELSSQIEYTQSLRSPSQIRQRLVGPKVNLRQTTLFGGEALENSSQSQSQSNRRHYWPLANREESPTHHQLNQDALKTWVYPTNLGTIREYQFNIVARGLYHNLLVALPTGLGKTFIAATIMLNWFRWTKDAQIVFVAPTKPLVSQQVNACFNVAGIPRSATTMLTGETPPGIRAEEWQAKRVFFMTPQTIANDLKGGICNPKRVVLLVVDEAHRATGGYAYVEVVKFLRRFNSSFRVLALTATPGSSVEGVQEVIDGLGISRVEIRTEESLDIRQYVHQRKVDTVIFENSEEMVTIMDLFSKALQPVLNKLTSMNAYWSRDPMALTPYGCTQARQKWMASDAGKNANWGVKAMVNTVFTLLASLSHATELLKYHGIGPFYRKVLDFGSNADNGEKCEKGGKYKKQIVDSDAFRKMTTKIQAWINSSAFVGHPKLEYLQSIVLSHFLDAGEGRGPDGAPPSSTRIMIFAHYRDSAEEVARVLKRNEPIIRPHVFVGQANSKGSDGMDQKKQLDIIHKFRSGVYNTLVATSIGEEGLDIGEVDLIICYDASASPIRMLQRMGRTGRKRAGNIVVTLMKGKEENNFTQAKDNYEKMQQMIAAGSRFQYHEDQAPRIVPRGVQPQVDKRTIDIPLENTQSELPEPKKRRKPPKKPPKKFHIPDGVRTGFTKASKLDDENSETDDVSETVCPRRARTPTPEPVPPLDQVLLTAAEEKELEHTYLDVGGDAPQTVKEPRLDAFPALQRMLRPTKYVSHGRATKRIVSVLNCMHEMTKAKADNLAHHLHPSDRKDALAQVERRAAYFEQRDHGYSSEHRDRTARSAKVSDSVAPFSHAHRRPSSFPSSPGQRTIHSRQDNLDEDEAMNDFINDDDEDVVDENEDEDLLVASSTSSPPPLAIPLSPKPFYKPSSQRLIIDSDSENQDLPELASLVTGKSFASAKTASADSSTPTHLVASQRRRARIVLESDSDD